MYGNGGNMCKNKKEGKTEVYPFWYIEDIKDDFIDTDNTSDKYNENNKKININTMNTQIYMEI